MPKRQGQRSHSDERPVRNVSLHTHRTPRRAHQQGIHPRSVRQKAPRTTHLTPTTHTQRASQCKLTNDACTVCKRMAGSDHGPEDREEHKNKQEKSGCHHHHHMYETSSHDTSKKPLDAWGSAREVSTQTPRSRGNSLLAAHTPNREGNVRPAYPACAPWVLHVPSSRAGSGLPCESKNESIGCSGAVFP